MRQLGVQTVRHVVQGRHGSGSWESGAVKDVTSSRGRCESERGQQTGVSREDVAITDRGSDMPHLPLKAIMPGLSPAPCQCLAGALVSTCLIAVIFESPTTWIVTGPTHGIPVEFTSGDTERSSGGTAPRPRPGVQRRNRATWWRTADHGGVEPEGCWVLGKATFSQRQTVRASR